MKNLFTYPFRFLCVLCAAVMVLSGVYKYYLDEDIATIDFHRFNGIGNDVYPTLSLCFNGYGIYNHMKIKEVTGYSESYEGYKYQKFLLGKYWSDGFVGLLKEENITLNAIQIIKDIHLLASSPEGPIVIYKWPKKTNSYFPFYQSFTSARDKCFSLDINIQTMPLLETHDLRRIRITIGDYYKGVFHQEDKPLNLKIFLTYPQQLIRSFPIFEIKNLQKRKDKNLVSVLSQGMEVMIERSKHKNQCKDNWMNDDFEIVDRLIQDVGCRLPQWGSSPQWRNVPICYSEEKFAELRVPAISTVDTKFLNKYIPPCRQIQTIISTSNIRNGTLAELSRKELAKPPFTRLDVEFQNVGYKSLKKVPALPIESLIGNLGGYIELCLGIALWNLPDCFDFFISKLRSSFTK